MLFFMCFNTAAFTHIPAAIDWVESINKDGKKRKPVSTTSLHHFSLSVSLISLSAEIRENI